MKHGVKMRCEPQQGEDVALQYFIGLDLRIVTFFSHRPSAASSCALSYPSRICSHPNRLCIDHQPWATVQVTGLLVVAETVNTTTLNPFGRGNPFGFDPM